MSDHTPSIDYDALCAEADDISVDKPNSYEFEHVGDFVAGLVTDVTTTVSEYDEKAIVPIITIRDKEGDEWSVFGWKTVLRHELQKANPRTGDGIIIKRLEDATGKKGKYQRFSVRVHRVYPGGDDLAAVEMVADGLDSPSEN